MKLYKIKYTILIEILSILLLTSCYGVLEDPVIVDKYYEPAYTQWIVWYNSNTHMTQLIPIFHSEQWVIVVEGAGSKDGEFHRTSIVVTQDKFNEVQIGDKYNRKE
jgi:hypothetical protein